MNALKAMKDALEALEYLQSDTAYKIGIDNLRNAIAEVEAAEPVAWEWVDPEKGMQISRNEPAEYEEFFELRPLYIHPPLSDEPVGFFIQEGEGTWRQSKAKYGVPLYTRKELK